MTSDLTGLILENAQSAGVVLSERQAELCRIHTELMIEWNRRVNLTRITDPGEIVVKHILDSLVPASELPRSGRSLDVGSGAGFPGVVLKIFSPDLDMILLDSTRKKVSFLAAVLSKLGLKGIRAVHGRWEDFAAARENANAFRLIAMRAVRLEPSHLAVLASRVLVSGGVFASWAGPESEKAACGIATEPLAGLEFAGSFSYALPGGEGTRSVWKWQKQETPGR